MATASAPSRQSRETYDRLLQGYREDGANHRAAARRAGIDWRTAKLVYLKGWPTKPWARPIAEVLEEERVRALSVIAERADRERQLAESARAAATQAAIEAKAADEEILRKARRVVLDVLANSEELKAPMSVLVKVVHAKVRDAVIDPTTGQPKPASQIPLDIKEAMQIIDRHTRLTARAVVVAEDIIQLGRTERNEPNAIVGHVVADMTPEQAAEEIEAQEQAIEIIRREGAGKVH